MGLKNNFYIMWLNNECILTNTQTHISYALDKETFCKLYEEDAHLHQDFIDAKIVDDQQKFDWPYQPLSRFFLETVRVNEDELESVDVRQFWENYLYDSENKLKKVEATEEVKCLKVIFLPVAMPIEGNLHELLLKRRTSREFFDREVTLQQLADILFMTFGDVHKGFGEIYMDVPENISWRRTSPGAGGLHSIDAYLFVRKVKGLETGIYFYDCKKHELRFMKSGDYEDELIRHFMSQHFCQGAAFHIATVSNLKIVSLKYTHSRGMILPYLDNGHLAQTALLLATGLGLQTWMTAALCDQFFAEVFNLKQYQVPLSVISIGHGCKESLGPRIREEIEKIKEGKIFQGAMAMAAAVREKVRNK